MTANAVIDGTYSDFKIVKTRSVFQMVIEGPIERAAEAVAMFGVPQPGQEIHVAVARLQVPAPSEIRVPESAPSGSAPGREHSPPASARPQETPAEASPPGAVSTREHKSEAARERYRMQDEMQRAVTRAALLCREPAFQDWMERQAPDDWMGLMPQERAAETIEAFRHALGIKSRSEIAGSEAAYRRFLALETDWKVASGQLPEERA